MSYPLVGDEKEDRVEWLEDYSEFLICKSCGSPLDRRLAGAGPCVTENAADGERRDQ